MTSSNPSVHSTWNFQDMMLHRVHEILLVSSPYDAFILEEDGRLTERVLHEYIGMNLTYAPRIWQTNTANQAMTMLTKHKIDLVIVMTRISDMDPITFIKNVKKSFPKKPVILLIFDESEIAAIPESVFHTIIDKVFVWSGNASVFPAIIKYVEDKQNVSRDTKKGDVRSIIVVEDTPRYYSIILPMLYKIILYHTKKLMNESLNDSHRILHMRARPKILLAGTYEEAEKYYSQYKNNVLGIISDIRFPHHGKLDPRAGIDLVEHVRKIDPDIPIMLQSTDPERAVEAKKIKVQFLHKMSPTLMKDLKNFIVNNFGFGNFVFRLPTSGIIGVAKNMYELQKQLETIPVESLKYHAHRNHFSNWLAARGEFGLATQMRPLHVSDFKHIEDLRYYLIKAISEHRELQQRGRVVDFSEKSLDPKSNFIRIADGSLGGKARGLAFANLLFSQSDFTERHPEVHVRVPMVAVIGTDEFDKFMDDNILWEFALQSNDNERILTSFLNARLSDELINTLKSFIHEIKFPLAVRSSSLLEDSQYQPLAGMYETYMLPNNGADEKRLRLLCSTIKRIYASTFFVDAKTIIDSSSHRHEEEKMAVIIQEMVGLKKGQFYYPTFSGVAQSYNYYPVSYMNRDEGIAFVALGLGRTVVEGGKTLRFSPKYPAILPQFYSIKSTIENSQNSFYALSLDSEVDPISKGEKSNLQKLELDIAEKDGVLKRVASVVSTEDNVIRDSLSYDGLRVVTFAPILKWNTFPLPSLLTDILDIGKKALGCSVEIEFSANIFDDSSRKMEFCILQIKPMVISSKIQEISLSEFTDDELIFKSCSALGNGYLADIEHVIYVKPESFDATKTKLIALEIESMNRELSKESKYVLAGPGRWGTADPRLGIPVSWHQISGAKVIVEMELDDFKIDPSFGSHFFQNVTSLRIGYFTITAGKRSKDHINWQILNDQTVVRETQFLKCIRFSSPLRVNIDGESGTGIVLIPKVQETDKMNEELSTGI
ncbi:MAG: histidine kinase [Candidatus Marinimicrobia bacterium]|nr:histidine kinase [Candidatus Neomarinimicrobiota bacterium]